MYSMKEAKEVLASLILYMHFDQELGVVHHGSCSPQQPVSHANSMGSVLDTVDALVPHACKCPWPMVAAGTFRT